MFYLSSFSSTWVIYNDFTEKKFAFLLYSKNYLNEIHLNDENRDIL